NPIIAEQKYMRPTLLPGIRRNLADNSRFFQDFRLFEIGREYSKDSKGVPAERTHLIAAIFNAREGREPNGASLLELKRVTEYLVPRCKVVPAKANSKVAHPERSAQVEVGEKNVGMLYELHPSLLDRGRAAILDLDLDALQALPAHRRKY